MTVGGVQIAYQAVAGTITVGATDEQDAQLGPDGKPQPDTEASLAAAASKDPKDAPPTARTFYVAYFKKDIKPESRPITFLYNGGPGSSTVWLHMGSFGPRHVVTSDDRHLAGAPYKLVNNTYSLLDVSDLVFIDMPGTSFGRLVGKDKEKAFWALMRMRMPMPASSRASSANTTAGTRPSISLGKATVLHVRRSSRTF